MLNDQTESAFCEIVYDTAIVTALLEMLETEDGDEV